MPGHFTAALASYGGLGCSGTAPPVDTGTGTLGNSICTTAPIAKTFIDDVIGQLAALTPGPYISVGGDEADGVSPSEYATFMTWAQQDVDKHGKTAIGWDAILNSTLAPSTVAEYWGATSASTVATAADNGTRIIMAPSSNAYMDQKYNASTVIGLTWANRIDMQTAYGWNPTTYVPGVPASAILGIEAPLWTETADTLADVDYLAFPRITAYAELGWSPESVTAGSGAFAGFAARVAAQGPRWDELGITYYHSTQIPWPTGPTGPTGSIVSQENNTCLDTVGGSTADGARVQIDTCATDTTAAAAATTPATADQQWTAASNGTLLDDGKCLDAAGAATRAGTPVELWDCNGGADQQWRAENGELVNPISGLCLSVTSGTDTPGSALDTAGCDNARPQWFSLPAGGYGAGPTGPVSSGVTGECLNASRGQSGDLGTADLYTCDATTAQNWSVGSDGTIQALGECLTVGGTEADLRACDGSGAQQWRWSSNGTYGESLTNQQSGLCLDDPDGSTENGTRLQLDACNGTLAQVWRLP
jgi:hexosaminidase